MDSQSVYQVRVSRERYAPSLYDRSRLMSAANLRKLMALLSMLIVSVPSFAFDYVVAGKISSIYYANPASIYNFQVAISTGLSGCASNIAYISLSDQTFNAYQAGLLSAYMSGKSVTIYLDKDSKSFCKIGDFAIAG